MGSVEEYSKEAVGLVCMYFSIFNFQFSIFISHRYSASIVLFKPTVMIMIYQSSICGNIREGGE